MVSNFARWKASGVDGIVLYFNYFIFKNRIEYSLENI